ncbi:MAG: hypothetical protein IT539_13790 [Bradyrhizobiaceae bacterium]|nr:hypothetical protein [Bradyrhizobiaceae bacterium]
MSNTDFTPDPAGGAPIESVPDHAGAHDESGVNWKDFGIRQREERKVAKAGDKDRRRGEGKESDDGDYESPMWTRSKREGDDRRARDESVRKALKGQKEKAAEAGKAKEARKGPAYSPNAVEDSDIRQGIISRSLREAKSGARGGKVDQKEWTSPEVRKARRELKAMFPSRKLSETWKVLENWDELFRTRPREEATATALREIYKFMPSHFGRAKDEPEEKGAHASMRRGLDDAKDLQDFDEAVKKYGANFPKVLVQTAAVVRGLIDDPANMMLRLGFNYEIGREEAAEKAQLEARRAQEKAEKAKQAAIEAGWQPPAQQQGQAFNPPRNEQERLGNIQLGLRQLIQSNLMPGIEHMLDDIAGIIERGEVPSGLPDNLHVLKHAYEIARARRQHGGVHG